MFYPEWYEGNFEQNHNILTAKSLILNKIMKVFLCKLFPLKGTSCGATNVQYVPANVF